MNVLLVSVLCLLWWFTNGCVSTSTIKPITVPLPCPPPAWASALIHRVYSTHISSLHSLWLQWWFIKGHNPMPAAEPCVIPLPRPPPSWGSFRVHLHSLFLLVLVAPVSASPSSTSIDTPPFHVTLGLLCPTLQLLARSHCIGYIKR
jgi:hypothetical protein